MRKATTGLRDGRWASAGRAAGLLGRAATAAVLACCVGCNDGGAASGLKVPVFPVKGKVTFEGEPAAGAFVVFNPKAPPKPDEAPSKPRATVQADGSFVLTTAVEGDGAPAGEYDVTVQWTKPIKQGNDFIAGPNVIPKSHASPATTPLHATVRESDNELEPFAITRK